MLELEEVREQLQEVTKKERQLLKNHEQASRYTIAQTMVEPEFHADCLLTGVLSK